MRRLTPLVALAAIAVLVPAGAASAQRDGSPDDPRAKAFVKEVSVDRVEHHQQRLQQIATANGGTRDVFGPGYTGSLNYVVRVLEKRRLRPADHAVQLSVLGGDRTARPQPGHADGEDLYAGHRGAERHARLRLHHVRRLARPRRSTTCRVVPVGGIVIPSPGGTDSGCAAGDYTGANDPAGAVALIQRGTCAFVQKIDNAVEAGAVGVIIFNEGNTPDRQNPEFFDLGGDLGVPTVMASTAVGTELYNAASAGGPGDGRPQHVRHSSPTASSTR